MQNLQNTDYTWISSNEDIAKVNSNGQVTGLKEGYTSIYATYKYTDENGNEKTILAECIINVAKETAVPQAETGNGFTGVLKADGTVWVVGSSPVSDQGTDVKPTQIKISETENLENIIKISAGTNKIIALNKFGQIYTYNIKDEYATKTTILNNIVDISAGNNKYVALDKDGNVYTWDNETEPQKQNLENIIRISVGNGNIGTLESNGILWSFGENGKGQLGLNSKTDLGYPLVAETDVTEISNGGVHAVIQKTDGKLYASGDMYQSSTFEEIALPENVTNANPIKYFKTGYNTTTIMLKDGTVYGEGGNTKGELGIGTNENASKFTQGLTSSDTPLTSVLMIGNSTGNGETSSLNTAVIVENGDVYVTGDNTNGQIGDGTTESKTYYTVMGKTREISLNKKNEYIKTGETLDINVLGGISNFNVFVNDNETGENINQTGWTWESSNEDVATIDANGVVTGISVGHTTITAYNEALGLKGRAIINVYRNVEGAITVPQVVHADSFTAVLKEDGTVWMAGQNNVGQLGDGTNVNKNEPVQVKIDENTYLTNVRKISVGAEWTTALTRDGKVYVWGLNDFGQLAQGDTTNLFYAKQVKIDENTYIENAIDISSGNIHIMVVTNDGKVYVAGHNKYYQNLSTGREEVVTYLKDTKLTNVIKVDAGYNNGSAMLSNGKTLSWGQNYFGALETQVDPTLQYVITEDAVDIKLNGYYTIIQKENGEIYVTGRNVLGQLGLGDNSNRNILTKIELPKDENGSEEEIKYISGSANNIMLMTKEGKIYVSGYNGYGQLCTGDTQNRNIFIPLVNRDGSKVTDALLLEEQAENSHYETGNIGLAFIKEDGTVWMSGDNTYGQIGNGTNTGSGYLTQYGTDTVILNKKNEYIKVGESIDIDVSEASSKFNVFIKDTPNQNEWTWTSSNEDVATIDENGVVTGISVGHTTITAYNEALGLKGRAIINVYRNVEGAITVPQVVHADSFTAVLKEDGTVWMAGQNNVGQLGDGTNVNKNEPVQVKIDENTYLTNVRKISVGAEWTTALTRDGKVYVWGLNDFGQLAQGDTTNLFYAKQVKIDENTYIENAIDISSGNIHIMVVTNDGKVYVAGHNKYYQNLSTGREEVVTYLKDTKLTNVIKVDAGYNNGSAMLSNGKTLSWGQNYFGALETQVDPTLQYVITEDAVDIKLNGYYTIIQKENGEIYVTGRNVLGQLGLGDNSNRNILTKIELPKDENGSEEEIKYISGTATNIMLMTKTGKIYVSGYNGYGQLCTGNTTNSNTLIPLVDKDGDIVTDCLLLEENQENGNYEHNSRGLAFIRKDGTVWMSGDNTYGQMGNGTNTGTNYLTKMEYIYLDYANKIVELNETGYQIDLNKLKYMYNTMNVFNDTKNELEVGDLEYTSADTNFAEVNKNGFITAMSGETEITIKDITNGYETKIKVLVNRLLVDTETVLYIYNIDDLVRFRDSVNAGNDYVGKTVYVMADIDMSPACSEESGVSWTPIGSTGTYFAGTFDGNYHKLDNIYINTTNSYQGLFAYNSGIIQSLIINTGKIQGVSHVGSIVGYNMGIINSCGNHIDINSNGAEVGGIAGTSNGNIYNCYNLGDIISTSSVSDNLTMIGGITGATISGEIHNCYNRGSIRGYGHYVGGISGSMEWERYCNISLANCYNTGIVESQTSSYVGSIIGNSTQYLTLSNCYYTSINNYIGLWLGVYGYPNVNNVAQVDSETIKTYASTLGTAYENDDFSVNEDYPILWWQAEALELNKKQAYIKTGENLQLEIIQNDDLPNALVGKTNITDFTWSSTNEDVATVNPNGVVKGLTEGYTTIYGKHKEYENVNVMCIINVAKAENIATPQVETGDGFVAILKADGTVWMTGNKEIITTGTGTNINNVENNEQDVVGAGPVSARGTDVKPEQVKISETEYLTNVIKISAGVNHVLALTQTGEVYAWGKNDAGQLGIGTTGDTTNTSDENDVGAGPVSAHGGYAKKVVGEGGSSTLKRIVDISAGDASSTATNEFGWVFVWGNGSNGEFGNAGTTSSNTPVKTVISNGISSSIGTGHVAIQGQNGKLYTWGRNDNGQLGTGNLSNNLSVGKIANGITDISASGNETIVKDMERKVYGTGRNTSGELGIEGNTNITTLTEIALPNTTNVKYIKAGKTNTTLMLSDGTVWSTGVGTRINTCRGRK